LFLASCNNKKNESVEKVKDTASTPAQKINSKSGFSDVNGIKMYYEIYGEGKPLVLIHGGGSTIQTTFGRIIPLLSAHHQVIAMELQAHGNTNDRRTPLSFMQDADDVAALLKNLEVAKADFLGFSNGGQMAIEIALRHPELVNKLIIASAFYKRSGTFPAFWKGMDSAKFSDMPQAYKDEYLKINHDSTALLNMFNRDVHRMQTFKGWSDEQMKSIKAPTLIVNSDRDVGTPEHAVEMYRLIPNSHLVILPGGHGTYLGEINTLTNGKWTEDYVAKLLEEFLDAPGI
jgi:pimeloyl-ACP methyl ester carboxylesterase